MNEALAFITLGVLTGILAGFFGVGGGIIMVPALIYFFPFTQYQAQGISLTAMLFPVGILGAYAYHKANPFPIKPAMWIALGIFFGAYLGSLWAQQISPKGLKSAFAILLVLSGLKMLLTK